MITFPVGQYPLMQAASQTTHESGYERDVMDDGTPRIRDLNKAAKYTTIPLRFAPLPIDDGLALIDYIIDNSGQEVSIQQHGRSISGYFWSDPKSVYNENKYYVLVDFYCKVVA